MKLILSRKGFDSGSGGVPSPIFPDGRMVSFPIPDKNSVITYDEINYRGRSLGRLVNELSDGRIPPSYCAHIDPDLDSSSLSRLPGWRPIFGQTKQSQGHLRNQGVGIGDLFLFFGLFRDVAERGSFFEWVPDATQRHIIWGWLQVAEVLELGNYQPHTYEWAEYHPHFHRGPETNNVIYLATHHLQLDRVTECVPGAGIFERYSADRQLTAPDVGKLSEWALPGWFYPSDGRTPLTYHNDMSRWRKRGNQAFLDVVARGQEFVLDCDEYPEAKVWAYDMIRRRDGES